LDTTAVVRCFKLDHHPRSEIIAYFPHLRYNPDRQRTVPVNSRPSLSTSI
jgi:hypothetical protein